MIKQPSSIVVVFMLFMGILAPHLLCAQIPFPHPPDIFPQNEVVPPKKDTGRHIRDIVEQAMEYFQGGDTQKAKDELKKLDNESLSQETRKYVAQLLAAIEDASKPYRWGIRFSQGFHHDSMINDALREDIVRINHDQEQKSWRITQWLYSFSPQKGIPGAALTTDFSGGLSYRLTPHTTWDSAIAASQELYINRDARDFGNYTFGFGTGPSFTGNMGALKLPVGYYQHGYYHNPSFRDGKFFRISPSYEYHSPHFSLTGGIDHFTDFATTFTRYELKPVIHISSRYSIAITSGLENYKERFGVLSYSGPYVGTASSVLLPTNTLLSLGYQWSQRGYAATLDHRHTIDMAIKQKWMQNFTTTLSFKHIQNSSSLSKLDYQKDSYTVVFGWGF